MDELDWVTSRSQCSIEAMFVRLLEGVRRDVAARTALASSENTATFEVVIEGEQEFAVVRNNGDTKRVRFERDARSIRVHAGKAFMFWATIQFNDQAECVFAIMGEGATKEEVPDWNLRCRALQKLFFER